MAEAKSIAIKILFMVDNPTSDRSQSLVTALCVPERQVQPPTAPTLPAAELGVPAVLAQSKMSETLATVVPSDGGAYVVRPTAHRRRVFGWRTLVFATARHLFLDLVSGDQVPGHVVVVNLEKLSIETA
jgi:hypothetical protein